MTLISFFPGHPQHVFTQAANSKGPSVRKTCAGTSSGPFCHFPLATLLLTLEENLPRDLLVFSSLRKQWDIRVLRALSLWSDRPPRKHLETKPPRAGGGGHARFLHVKTEPREALSSPAWQKTTSERAFPVFRLAFRKQIVLGDDLARVFAETLRSSTWNEPEVNKTKQRSLKTGVLPATERGNAFMLYLSKHSIRR